MIPPQGTEPPALSRAAALLLASLEYRCQRYLDSFRQCQQEYSREAVHNLRVSTRRLLIILEIMENLFLEKKGRKFRRELKKQLNSLDGLMDIQVQIAYVGSEMTGMEGGSDFLNYLVRRETYLLEELRQVIGPISIDDHNRRISKIRLLAVTRLKVQKVRECLVVAVDNSYSNLLQRFAKIDPGKTKSIHRTRIVFKSFRYTVEIIHPLLFGYPEVLLTTMDEYQGMMGIIQDIEVLQDLLEAFGEKHPHVNISLLMDYVGQRHQEYVTTFLSQMDSLHAFWRASPQARYPWNKPKARRISAPS